MALEPRSLQLAGRHATGHNDLEGALAEAERRRLRVLWRRLVQAVEAVAAPVEFLLQRDHARARGVDVGAGSVEVVAAGQDAGAECGGEVSRELLRLSVKVAGKIKRS